MSELEELRRPRVLPLELGALTGLEGLGGRPPAALLSVRAAGRPEERPEEHRAKEERPETPRQPETRRGAEPPNGLAREPTRGRATPERTALTCAASTRVASDDAHHTGEWIRHPACENTRRALPTPWPRRPLPNR